MIIEKLHARNAEPRRGETIGGHMINEIEIPAASVALPLVRSRGGGVCRCDDWLAGERENIGRR